MADAVIENPILDSPFAEPTRHFKFSDEGITNEVVDGRRVSSYFIPIAQPKKKGKQLVFDTEWTRDRIEENKNVNRIRPRVSVWREGGYLGVTPTTARLLEYWNDPDRERKLFFCQIEALETVIYVTEVAKKYGDAWIENALRDANDTSNPGLLAPARFPADRPHPAEIHSQEGLFSGMCGGRGPSHAVSPISRLYVRSARPLTRTSDPRA